MNDDLFYEAANARALGRSRVPQVWTVSQVNALARDLLEGSLPALWVAGEVSGFKRYPAGHCFFTLKDKKSQLGCVMWREAARTLPAEPPEGLAVHVFGYPTVYERAGRFQFVVHELNARGEGLWRAAFERARRKLEAEGLLDASRKRGLPPFPSVIGVVTSLEGAALRDIVSIIKRRAPWIDIIVYPTRVQGEGASESIVAALSEAARGRRVDLLIVGRGGGSAEDLQAFNDEAVARAIASCPVAVISAVGHEIDVTLSDLVADLRAPTPSTAAEIAAPEVGRLLAELHNVGERLSAAFYGRISRKLQRVERLEERLIAGVRRTIESRRRAVGGLRQRLQALGPMGVLRRGYAVALDERGHILRSINVFRRGMGFTLRLADGRVQARAEAIEDEGQQ
ncbi:MAG: exodeoxyribonuclease VII large subunit [Gemmatimonadota bacterium]|nr:MAG: exodeoxyribonuclease VII large subunit [Gemmatimonadota bacterium]